MIRICFNDQKILRKMDQNSKLNVVRQNLSSIMIDNTVLFVHNDQLISTEEERNMNCSSILSSGNELHLRKVFIDQQNDSIQVIIDQKHSHHVKINENQMICKLRNQLASIVKAPFVFAQNEAELDISQEEEVEIKDMLQDHIINVTTKKECRAAEQPQANNDRGELSLITSKSSNLVSQELRNSKIELSTYLQPEFEENKTENIFQQQKTNGQKNPSLSMSTNQIQRDDQSLFEEAKNMPLCAERSLQRLIFYTSLKLLGNDIQQQKETNFEILLNLDAYMEEEYKNLIACLIDEKNYGIDIEDSINQCVINSKAQNWQKVYRLFKSILKEIKPLSIHILKELISKVDLTAQLIKKQDTIMLLGGTGSGKSTLIHFMAGSEMQNVQVNGINHIQPSKVFNQMLDNVITSPFAESQTRYITPVQVEFSSIKSINRGNIMLVDSPGFEDTNGAEVDIANSIGIIKAVQNCKSVRPVILMSYLKLGDRMTGIKDLAHLLITMIPGMQQHFERFTYVFTKFPKNEQSCINAKLKDTIQKMSKEEKRDDNFENLLANIYKQTKNGAFIIDPINDLAGDTLDKIMEVKPIKRPSEVFQTFISQKSQSVINQQVQKHQLAIFQAARRGDYEIINYKLNELSFLAQELCQDSISQLYTKCVEHVSSNLTQTYQTATSNLNKCLIKNNNLTMEDVLLYKKFIQSSISAEVVVKSHLIQHNVPHTEAYMIFIKTKLQDFVKEIQENDIFSSLVVSMIIKIQLFQEHFEEIKIFFDKILAYINEKQNQSIVQFSQSLQENNFKEASNNYFTFKGYIAQYGQYFDQNQSQNQLENMNQALFKHLDKLTNSQLYVLKKETLSQEEIKTLSSSFQLIKKASSYFNNKHYSNLDYIKAIEENFTKQILIKFNQISNKIILALANENQENTQNVKACIEQLDNIHNIEQIKNLTIEKYIQTQESLKTFISEQKKEGELILNQIEQQHDQVNYHKLSQFLDLLKNYSWLNSYQDGIIEENKLKIIEKILLVTNNKILKFNGISIDLENTKNFVNASKLIKQFESILNAAKNIPDLENLINQCLEKFSNEVQKVISEISNLFGTYKKNNNYIFQEIKAYQSLIFLQECSTMNFLQKIGWKQTLSQVKSFIEEYGEEQKQKWKLTQTRLQQYKDDSIEDKICIPELANSLYDCFNEVYQLSQNYYPVYQIYGKEQDCKYVLKEKYKKDLMILVEYIREEMQLLYQQRQLKMLSVKLQVAKNLKIMDEFLPQNQNFCNIQKDFQDKLHDNQSEYNNEIVISIKEYSYNDVLNGFMKLDERKYDNSDTMLRLKDILNRSLKELIEETITMANRMRLRKNIKEDRVQSIVKNLKIIQEGEKYLSDYMEPKDMLAEVKKKIQEIIKKGMLEYIKYIDSLINNNNFQEAKEELTNIDLLCDILGVFCLQEVIDAIKKSNLDLDEQLKKIIKYFKEMKIEKYLLDPPKEIFEKLQKGIEDNYNTTLAQIQTDILQQLRNELSDIQNVVKNKTREQRIGKLEAVLQHLPQKIKNIIEQEIKCVKDNIVNTQNERKKELQTVFESENIEEIKQRITQYQYEGDTDTLDYIKQEIQNKIKFDTDYIVKNIFKVIDSDFEHHFRKLNDCLKYIEKFLPSQYTQSIKATFHKVNTTMDYHFGIINSFFDNNLLISGQQTTYKSFNNYSPKINNIKNDNDDIYHAIKCLIGFINFKQQYSDEVDWFPKFDKYCLETIEKSNNTLELIQNLYKESLQFDVLDIVKLQQVYNENTKYENVFKLWMENSEVLSQSQNTIFKKFNKTLKQGYKLNDRMDNLRTNIGNLKSQFINNCEAQIDQNQQLIQSERDKVFCQMNKELRSLCDIKSLDFFNNSDLCVFGEQAVALLKSMINRVTTSVLVTIEESDFSKEECSMINIQYSKIKSFNDNIDKNFINIEEQIKQVDKKIIVKINEIYEQIKLSENIQNIASGLIKIQAISTNLSFFKNICHNNIQKAILYHQSKQDGKICIAKIGQALDQNPLGQLLIQDHKVFDGFSLSLFNQKIQKHDIKYVLEKIKGVEIDTDKLGKRFQEYEINYNDIVKKYLKPNSNLKEVYLNLKSLIHQSSINQINKQLQMEHYEKIPEILAYLCALWTLENASYFFEADGLNNQESYLFQPHAAQVISILRIIGSGDKTESLQNHLIQVGTGEGKSIVLAMSAALLAICGYDVNCTCYSSYLSNRDYQQFRTFFENLGLINNIHYGTFGEICEANINENGNVRKIVENVINEIKYDIVSYNKTQRPKILLMDEVDVFFSKDFYGNHYSPISCIKHQTITSLITLIWQRRSEQLTLDKIKVLPEYKQIQQQFKNWNQIIDNSIINMILNVQDYKNPEYIILNDNIGYKEQDKIGFNIAYGYKTVFAYFDAHEKGLVSQQSLENNIYIDIRSGQFSYADIPTQFAYILGVSGTLDTLNDSEKYVIKDQYKIYKQTISPSVFGKNNRRFNKHQDCHIENSCDYFNSLQQEIQNRLIGTNPETRRAVLVFFENQQSLMKFYNHQVYDSLRDKTKYLTEEASEIEKQNVIKQSTFSGEITFFTKSYGRGTDIISRDEIVKNNGGVHVIQAFLSDDKSEEVQIMGRTARQGDFGSFSMVILESSLEKILVTPRDIINNKKGKYELINKKRNKFFNDQYQANKEEYVKNSKKMHDQSCEFLSKLVNNDLKYVNDFLLCQNKCSLVETISKTLVIMDGTVSMSGLITKAKTTVTTMFEQASVILKSNGLSEGCFELQFAIFRSYNLDVEDLLQASGWEKNPENLRKFTEKVSAKGGQGREAVEIGLQYASQLNGVSQVILIGDAPPTIPEDIEERRNQKGEEYWKKTKFNEKTDYIKQSYILKNKNIMVHAFFVDEDAEKEFEEISEITGGTSAFLDVNSNQGSEMLTQTVTKTILSNIGQQRGQGEALAIDYMKTFGKGFK